MTFVKYILYPELNTFYIKLYIMSSTTTKSSGKIKNVFSSRKTSIFPSTTVMSVGSAPAALLPCPVCDGWSPAEAA